MKQTKGREGNAKGGDLKRGRAAPYEEAELWEIIYFKLYKSQLPVVEKAVEKAGLPLGSDNPDGCCLEMICVDFLAGSNAQS